jgi:hypothetical protein
LLYENTFNKNGKEHKMTEKNLKSAHTRMFEVSLIFFGILFFISCGPLPSHAKTDGSAKGEAGGPASAKEEKGERLDVEEPKAGDIKVLDGVEYVYGRNKKYMLTPYEQEYVWIRKDQYTPGLGETVMNAVSGSSQKDRSELEARIAKLEEEYKKKGIAPLMAYPEQMAALPRTQAPLPQSDPSRPQGGNNIPVLPSTTSSPLMKRRVMVLPVEDKTSFPKGGAGEFATRKLVSRLENTNGIICIDPGGVNVKPPFTRGPGVRTLNEVYGIQAVVKATLSDAEAPGDRTSSKLDIEVYNTETGTVLKHLSGRGISLSSREQGEIARDKTLTASIELSVESVSEDLLRSILTIDWHARVASLEMNKIYINAGRQSGLEKGALLEVYSPGTEAVDLETRTPLGKTKGSYKGELKVSELFGIDASWATPVKGGGFTATDLVYVKKE